MHREWPHLNHNSTDLGSFSYELQETPFEKEVEKGDHNFDTRKKLGTNGVKKAARPTSAFKKSPNSSFRGGRGTQEAVKSAQRRQGTWEGMTKRENCTTTTGKKRLRGGKKSHKNISL